VLLVLVGLVSGTVLTRVMIGALGSKFVATAGTLSGRSELFQAAWTQFLHSPLIGKGTLRVAGGLEDNRSAHNTYLALASAAGALVLVPLLMMIVETVRRARRAMAVNDPTPAAVAVVAIIATVQGLELQQWAWFLIGAAMSFRSARHAQSSASRGVVSR
jgi:O-antigen ligase